MSGFEVRSAKFTLPGVIADLIDGSGIAPNCPDCLLPMEAGADGWACDQRDHQAFIEARSNPSAGH